MGSRRQTQALEAARRREKQGDLDVAAADKTDYDSPNGGKIAWWENVDGLGLSWTEHSVDPLFPGATAIELGDIDYDGHTDILAAAIYGDETAWWRNDGTPKDGG